MSKQLAEMVVDLEEQVATLKADRAGLQAALREIIEFRGPKAVGTIKRIAKEALNPKDK